MQPVTIKSNQYTNTLWLMQILLLLILMLAVLLTLWVNISVSVLLPFIALALWINHRTIKRQATLQFKLHTSGRLSLRTHDTLGRAGNTQVVIDASWQIPHVLMLKLKSLQDKQNIYLTVFRSVMGEQQFSNLLVGIGQHEIAEKLKS